MRVSARLWLASALEVGAALVAPPIELEPWIRVRKTSDGRAAALETCSRTYESASDSEYQGLQVELVGLVHCGASEYYSAVAQSEAGTWTLYESLVDDWLLDGKQRLAAPIGATRAAKKTASSTGLVAQSDALGSVAYEAGWTIADQAKTGASYINPAVEAAQLLAFGRAAFNRLDLAIGATATRAACALAPCPELSLALVDWSWSSPRDGNFLDSIAIEAATTALSDRNLSVLARLALLRSLVRAGAALPGEADPNVLERNDQIVRWIRRAALLDRKPASIRVMYGAMHMRDLDKKLRSLGFRRKTDKTANWRSAFQVPLKPKISNAAANSLSPLILIFAAFCALDAADYVYSIFDAFTSYPPPLVDAGLYFCRHASLYYALTKFVLA